MPQGSLVAVELAAALAAPDQLQPTLIYAPDAAPKPSRRPRTTRDHLLVTELDNVRGRAYVYTPEPRRQLVAPRARAARQRHRSTSSIRTCTVTGRS